MIDCLTEQKIDFAEIGLACQLSDVEQFVKTCSTFYDLLIEVNRTTNLTRITSESDFWIKHVIDSLYLAKFFPGISKEELQVLDFGCGAGIPSIILAIAFPNLQLTSVDSVGKKVAFIADVAKKLDLRIDAVHGRGRELNRRKDWQKRFDVITARAVAEAKVIFRETKSMLNTDGQYLLYKTPDKAAEEIADVQKLSAKQNLEWHITDELELPLEMGQRVFLYSNYIK